MKKVFFILTTLFAANSATFSSELPDSLKQVKLDEVIVSSTKAGNNTPIAFSNMSAKEIKTNNTAKNIPFILQELPSVVAFSEDGSGVGNTSLRIRGTDATRINVTLNGMPLNNPESQEVYWVNLPDISNSLQSIQVQRGVGTSTFGSAAFGASLSLTTVGGQSNSYGEASTAIGSYNTVSSTIAAGTGILKNGLSLDLRYSRVTGDGYIRNGKVDHKNLYVSLSHYSENQLIRLNYINGIQHTGITWEGISPDKMKADRKYNPAGRYYDDAGNLHYYDNETDNYYSNIVQFLYSKEFDKSLTLNANLSYNNGYGYYENYKRGQSYIDYGLPNQLLKDSLHVESDLIRQKKMSNDFYTGNISVNYYHDKFSIISGIMLSYFDGDHYGELPWIKFNKDIAKNYEWYRNSAEKKEIGGFSKIEYRVNNSLSVFGDIQYRYIDYRMKGIDDDLTDIKNNKYYSFFNPKAGATFNIDQNNNLYASLAIANREPLRSDIKESIKKGGNQQIKSERVYDYELGYKYTNQNAFINLNMYYMNYKDQMVQTGKLNDVGYKLMENIPDSYRMGIELIGKYQFTNWIGVGANVTLSKNKMKNYTAYFDVYNDEEDVVDQNTEFYKSTNISFSPSVISSGVITVTPLKDLNVSLAGKYVGKQYYDNTSNKENRLNDYFVSNLTAGYTFKTQKIGSIDIQITVNNLMNKRYVANAWVDTSYSEDGEKAVYKGLYPQATRNIMAKLGIRF